MPKINSFLEGFHELVPADLISIFNPQELELLISGLPDININDLQANTEYQHYKPSDPQIQWFWSVLRSFSQEEKPYSFNLSLVQVRCRWKGLACFRA
ncbi:unnamed protein product [Heterosigma akashiwo]